MKKTIRQRLAAWLDPEAVSFEELYKHNSLALSETNTALLHKDDLLSVLRAANEDYRHKLTAAGLRITVMGRALKTALNYLHDVRDDLESEIASAKSKNRKASLSVTLEAVKGDIKQVQEALNAYNSAETPVKVAP